MALFGSKKQKKIEEKGDITLPALKVEVDTESVFELKNPRVTEKSHDLLTGSNTYVFNVGNDATKGKVKNAVRTMFKVSPVRVTVLNVPRKQKFVRGKMGVSGGGKKAYVTLKKGDKIE